VKPRQTHRWAVHFKTEKLIVAEDRAALVGALEKTGSLGLETIVTEIIPGPETRLLSHAGYLDEHGEPLSQFTFRKYRQLPIHFGIGTYVVSDWNEEVIEAGLAFLRAAGLRGLFHVEFKHDERDGELKLLECNHRFTIESSFAPVDLPLLAYSRVLGRPSPAPRRYRSGVHLWEPYRDLRALLAYRRRGELSVAGWLRTLAHRQRFHSFAWSDPRPALYSRLVLARRWLRKRLGLGRGRHAD
jgi:predicted ATP-grasp superfamily ATP-dependent carboligase